MNDEVERFTPTSGRLMGGLALAVSLLVVVVGLVAPSQGIQAWLIAVTAFTAALSWAAMLRPTVTLVADDLVMRNMLETVHVPLAAVEDVVVRQVLAVRAGNRRFISPAIGRTRRQIGRDARSPSGDRVRQLAESSYGAFVEERIRSRAAEARAKVGVTAKSEQQQALAADVRRRPAWPEIVALAATALAVLVTLLF